MKRTVAIIWYRSRSSGGLICLFRLDNIPKQSGQSAADIHTNFDQRANCHSKCDQRTADSQAECDQRTADHHSKRNQHSTDGTTECDQPAADGQAERNQYTDRQTNRNAYTDIQAECDQCASHRQPDRHGQPGSKYQLAVG